MIAYVQAGSILDWTRRVDLQPISTAHQFGFRSQPVGYRILMPPEPLLCCS